MGVDAVADADEVLAQTFIEEADDEVIDPTNDKMP